ncbi:TonB-dependent receptor plug domain-containing protein [Pseudomonas nunensis]|uniref:TonB-dependent receptor n=1 Tax=Pseudomonas nunensis TaxID=2961896 RepID=A0ABY5ELF8_9PSED|nr:TonB-dependent receptor [Pseudomonas nunensis]KPN90279.1 ligand-gated channel [Pseudomonas nunensis]MCL5227869.1 TonB-dependent receptor [Pseudomonas nunensis]UTO16519.1 TonB-dependent receptor [Pseudomonas nunensis]
MYHRSRSLLAAAVVTAMAQLPVQAEETSARADDDTRLGTVLVTGTRGTARTVLDSPVPVDVLTAEDLKSAGASNGELGQALQTLLPSFSFPRQSNSGGADHVRAAQLRGMSPDQVLVLVNGKRRHTSALVNDSSKIGRGTAPVDFNSIPISAIKRIEVLRDGAGAQYGSDAIAGVINIILDDAPEGGEISTTYGAYHTHQDAIGKTTTDGQNSMTTAKIGTRLGEEGGFIRGGTEYKDRDPTNRAGFDGFADTPGQRNYVMGDGIARDVNAWFNSELPLAGGKAYSFGTYNERHTTGAEFYRYPSEQPQFYPNGYLPQSLGDNQDISATAGFKGLIGDDWDFDSSVTHGRNHFDSATRRTLNVTLGADSPTRFDTGEYELRQTTANLDFTRELRLAGRPFVLALGGEYRYENYLTFAGDEASYIGTGADGANGLRPSEEVDLDRNVFGTYAELSGDVTDRLFVDAATRWERYDDAGSKLTGKLSGRYRLTDQWALRGAVSNNFRAPSLAQIGFQNTTSNFGDGGTLTDIRVLSVNDPIARALGAEKLDPETSKNFSLGLTAQLSERFDASLDVFRIDVKDRVTLSQRIGSDALEQYINDNFGVAGVHDVNFFTNAADTRTDGAELVLNYHQPLYEGLLGLTTAYTYNHTKVTKTKGTPSQLTALGIGNDALVGVEERNTLTDAAPKDRFMISANWASQHWGLLGRLTRQGETTRVFDFGNSQPEQTYGAVWQLDAEVQYKFTPKFDIALGGNNLTDNYPERSKSEINYGGNLPYDVLSPIGTNGAYYYARATYGF